MDDPTLPRMPVVLSVVEGAGVRVFPKCEICGTEVLDLTDPQHHVCVPDPAGAVKAADGSKWTKTTRDVGEKNYRDEQARADELAAAALPAEVPPVP